MTLEVYPPLLSECDWSLKSKPRFPSHSVENVRLVVSAMSDVSMRCRVKPHEQCEPYLGLLCGVFLFDLLLFYGLGFTPFDCMAELDYCYK